MLRKRQFDVVEQMIIDIPHMLTSFRGVADTTLLMNAGLLMNSRIFQFLVQFEQDFTVVDRYRNNIAHYTAWGVKDAVQRFDLIKSRTSYQTFTRLLNGLNKGGNSALHYAALKNNHTLIKYLIENDADVNIRNNEGELPEDNKHCDKETKRLIRQHRK